MVVVAGSRRRYRRSRPGLGQRARRESGQRGVLPVPPASVSGNDSEALSAAVAQADQLQAVINGLQKRVAALGPLAVNVSTASPSGGSFAAQGARLAAEQEQLQQAEAQLRAGQQQLAGQAAALNQERNQLASEAAQLQAEQEQLQKEAEQMSTATTVPASHTTTGASGSTTATTDN